MAEKCLHQLLKVERPETGKWALLEYCARCYKIINRTPRKETNFMHKHRKIGVTFPKDEALPDVRVYRCSIPSGD